MLLAFALTEFTGLLGFVIAMLILLDVSSKPKTFLRKGEDLSVRLRICCQRRGRRRYGSLSRRSLFRRTCRNLIRLGGRASSSGSSITFGVLYWLMAGKFLPAIGGAIEERKDRIADDLDQAGDFKRQAEDAENAYNQALSDAKAKAQSDRRR